MTRCAWPALCMTVLCSVLAMPAAPALAAPGNGPRVTELAGAAVHPWRLEIHRPPDGPESPPANLPLTLPLDELPVGAASQSAGGAPAVSHETRERTFAELHALGVRHVRVDLLWCQVEADAAKPDWTVFDSVVASAERFGLELTPVVLCAPGWANGNRHYLTYPTDMATFEAFFARALARYPQIRAWEIWNEPNHEYFARPEPSVERFVELLRSAHRARASVGSGAQLISGGLAVSRSFPMFDFVERMADAGALDLIDGLGIHPYSARAPDDARSTIERLPELRRRLVARERPIPIWLTEYGVPDSTRGSGYGAPGNEKRQADLLRRAYAVVARWPWVARLTWYEARDTCDDAAEPECRLGLIRPDFRRKRAAAALRDLLAGGPFPRLTSAITVRVSPARSRIARRSRRAGRAPARVYRVSGAVFRPAAGPSAHRLSVTLTQPGRRPRPRRTRARIGRSGVYSVALGSLRPGRYRVRVAFRGDAYHARSVGERVFRVHAPQARRAGRR